MIELKATRDGLGEGLLELGKINPKVVVLSADLSESTRANWFKEKYPKRYVEVGVAEQNLIGVAAGLAQEGFIPFCASFAAFSPGRNWEQIRTSVCINNANVKIASTHAGITVGEDGASHQALEDIALMRVLPNMTVISPCDSIEAQKATMQAALYPTPCYLRFSREKSPIITKAIDRFKIGQANILKSGRDLTIFSHGLMVSHCLEAAIELKNQLNIEIINIHTIKPLDGNAILKSIHKTKKAIVVEEAMQIGGLFSAITELTSKKFPINILPIAIDNRFGQSGSATDLLRKYSLTTSDIIKKILKYKN